MKKKMSKKIIGGLIIASILVTIGAVIVSADIGEDNEQKNWPFGFKWKKQMENRHKIMCELTEEQREEIKELKETLEEEGITPEEIREAIKQQLESYGIDIPTREERLDMAIENTEQKLEILKYIRELIEDNPDLTKEEIRDLVETEFEIELPEFDGNGMNFRPGFRGRNCDDI
jgi:hypothetical protein